MPDEVSSMKSLKVLRRRERITQQMLAQIMGVNRSTVSMWEIGASSPNVSMLIRLADYFNVSTDYILGRRIHLLPAEKELLEYLDELRNRPGGKMLFRLMKEATKEDVERAVKIIEALKK